MSPEIEEQDKRSICKSKKRGFSLEITFFWRNREPKKSQKLVISRNKPKSLGT